MEVLFELLLELFFLLLVLGFALAPFIAVVLLVIYIVAPQMLPFGKKRANRNTRSRRSNSGTRRKKTAQTREEPTEQKTEKKEPVRKKKPDTEVILSELKKHSEGIQDEELKTLCLKMHEHLQTIHEMEADSKELSGQMENMYTSYLPSFVNVLSRYERLQYADNQETLSKYRSKVLQTADVIDDALINILETAQMKNLDALGKDMQELETVLKADGVAGQLELPKQQ